MNIDSLTLGQIKEIQTLIGTTVDTHPYQIGKNYLINKIMESPEDFKKPTLDESDEEDIGFRNQEREKKAEKRAFPIGW